MNRLIKILSCALCCALLLTFAAAGRAQGYSRYSMMFFDVFDTVITLTGFAESQEVFSAAAQDTQKLLTHYHQLFDQYHEYPDTVNLCTLNKTAAGAPVAVSQELFDFLSWCVDLQEQYGSDHTNIALGKVLQLWHEAREEGIADPAHARLPDEEALRAASAHTDIHALVLDKERMTVYYADPLMQLDVGAVAKGYAAQKAAQALLESPMPSFILNAGGNVCLGNPPMDGRARWGVGVQDPDAAMLGADSLMETLYGANVNVVTSGDYQRYYTVNGKNYSHLISPETLFPADTFRCVTVVAQDGGLCDFLSTWLFIATYEEGRALVDSLPGVEAYWVLADREVRMTDGMAAYAKSMGATSK